MLTRKEFVYKYYPFVKTLTSGTGLFPETVLSQAIVESQSNVGGTYYPGASKLAKNYNNYFGIKAGSSWKGKSVNLDTGEYYNGSLQTVNDSFRVYPTVEDSFRDYVNFLRTNPRYSKAGVFSAKTAKEQASALQAAGYSTNPGYADLVSSVGARISSYFEEALAIAKRNSGTIAVITAGIFFF